jgi:hypothetical protein
MPHKINRATGATKYYISNGQNLLTKTVEMNKFMDIDIIYQSSHFGVSIFFFVIMKSISGAVGDDN